MVSSELLERVLGLLSNLAKAVVRQDRASVVGKVGKGLFLPVSEFVHIFEKKSTKTEERKGKTPKKEIVVTIKATKPSQLATVAPCERGMISELYEGSWDRLKKIMDDYQKEVNLDFDFAQASRDIRAALDEQWKAKQETLRLTKHRMLKPEPREQLHEVLQRTRDMLAPYTGYNRDLYNEENPPIDPREILPSRQITDDEGFKSDLLTLYRAGKLGQYYPKTDLAIRSYDSCVSAISEHRDG